MQEINRDLASKLLTLLTDSKVMVPDRTRQLGSTLQ